MLWTFWILQAEYCNADRTMWKLTLQGINTKPKELKTERDRNHRQLFRPLWGSWYGVILWVLRVLGQGLNQSAGIFFIRAFFGCYAILTSPKKGETAVYGYNPALFWVLSVSCWCLAELIFTWYDQHCSILLAEFNMSTFHFCWSGLYRFYVRRHIRLRPFAVPCGYCLYFIVFYLF